MRAATTIFGLFSFCGLWAALAAAQSPPVNAPTLDPSEGSYPEVGQAAELFRGRQFDAALETLLRVTREHAEMRPANIVLYDWFSQTGHPGLAQVALEKAVFQEAPDDPESFLIMGDLAMADRRVAEAQLLYAEAGERLKQFNKGTVRKERLQQQVARGMAAVDEMHPAAVAALDAASYIEQGDSAFQGRRVTAAELLYEKGREMLAGFAGTAEQKSILEQKALNGLAAVAEKRGKWKDAQQHLEKWLAIDPRNSAALLRLAGAQFQQGNAADAYATLKRAKSVDPQNVLTPEVILARGYEDFGDHRNARIWMSNALKVAPADLRTRLAVAEWDLETSDLEKAKKDAEKALEIDSRSLEAKILRGRVAMFQKDYNVAEKWLQDAYLQSPNNFAASNNLALTLCEQHDEVKLQRAKEIAQVNYQQDRNNCEAVATLGWVFYKFCDIERANLLLRQAIVAGSRTPDTLYYLAQVNYARGVERRDSQALLVWLLQGNRCFRMRPEATALLKTIEAEMPNATQ